MRIYSPIWLIFSVAVVILGIACIANPLDTMAFLAYIIGFIMLFSGLGEIVYFIQSRFYFILLDGLISCILGGILLFSGDEIASSFIPLLVALWLIFKGVLWLVHILRAWQILQARFMLVCMSLSYILLGIIFVIFPEILSAIISLVLGGLLIVSGVVGLWIWNKARKFDKIEL